MEKLFTLVRVSGRAASVQNSFGLDHRYGSNTTLSSTNSSAAESGLSGESGHRHMASEHGKQMEELLTSIEVYFNLKMKVVVEEVVEDDWCWGEEVGRLCKHRGQDRKFYQTKPSWEQGVV